MLSWDPGKSESEKINSKKIEILTIFKKKTEIFFTNSVFCEFYILVNIIKKVKLKNMLTYY